MNTVDKILSAYREASLKPLALKILESPAQIIAEMLNDDDCAALSAVSHGDVCYRKSTGVYFSSSSSETLSDTMQARLQNVRLLHLISFDDTLHESCIFLTADGKKVFAWMCDKS